MATTQGRPNKGNIERRGGKPYAVRVTLPDGSRPRIYLPAGCSEALAAERCERYAALAAAGELELAPKGPPPPATPRGEETVAGYAVRWLEERRASGILTVDDDDARLRLHVLDLVGKEPIATAGRDAIEAVRDDLDRKVRAGEISSKTAGNVWTNVTSLFGSAHRAKKRALRVRQDDPTRDILPPDRETELDGQFLYPSEFIQLATCPDVPLRWRRLVAVAVYTGRRASELRALTWGDVDLAHQRLSITKQRTNNWTSPRATKTSRASRPQMLPELGPLLAALAAEAKGAGKGEPHHPVLWMPKLASLAIDLRRWLLVAQVRRPELHADSPTSRVLVFHNLRTTHCTWSAVRGEHAYAIMQRTGHRDRASLDRYVEAWGHADPRAFGEPFPVLPAALLGEGSSGHGFGHAPSAAAKKPGFSERETGFETSSTSPAAPFWGEGRGDADPVTPETRTPATGSGHGSGHGEWTPGDLAAALVVAIDRGELGAARTLLAALQELLTPGSAGQARRLP